MAGSSQANVVAMEPPTKTISGGPVPATWYARCVPSRMANEMPGASSTCLAHPEPSAASHLCSVASAPPAGKRKASAADNLLERLRGPCSMVRSMVGLEFPAILNDILRDASRDEYANAQSVVEAADTVQEAVESAGVLERLSSETGRVEARAVLAAIPPAVDEAIIAALENAFERRLPVEVSWLETEVETIEARISEEPFRDGQLVRITFVCRDGATFI